MTVRPVVDAVEREFGDALKVIRLNVQDPAGRELARSYGFKFTPTFILIDAEGRELWRSVYVLDAAHLRALLRSP
jgi:thioredoxin-related protein